MAPFFPNVTIKVDHTNKPLELLQAAWWFDSFDRNEFLALGFQPVPCELVSQIFDFFLHKEAFSQICSKSFILESFQNRLQFLQMIGFRLVVTLQ